MVGDVDRLGDVERAGDVDGGERGQWGDRAGDMNGQWVLTWQRLSCQY